ncbi:MAG: DUF2807 domain-containing protein [Candidatus Paceibacterota bacterium]|jgi:uncharacterized membrane protein YiaA
MKKISFIFIGTVIINLLIMLSPRSLDGMVFGYIPVILIYLLIPFVSGILFILLQNKNRSYEFLPILFIGTLVNNIAIVLVAYFVEYSRHLYLYKPPFDFYMFLDMFSPFVVLSLAGGLIGLVIRGISEQFKKYPNSKITITLRKIFGGIFLGVGSLGILTSVIIFLILFFNPSCSWLQHVMVDFRIIDVVEFFNYYLSLLSLLAIITIPLFFVGILGLMLFSSKKNIFNLKLFLKLILLFILCLGIFILQSCHLNTEFQNKKTELKEKMQEVSIDIKDFDSIYISRYVKFDDIIIKQGEYFDIKVIGSEYDQIGLEFAKVGDTLNIKRSELETYYNTNTWTMENDKIPFAAGTKRLTIEITMPDIEKIENEAANIILEDLEINNLEIKLTHRFNNIKGNIEVANTLKLEAEGGIINLTGSAKNLIINSGDCWIEMDKFTTEQATINAINTSRLNVYVTGNMEVVSGKNSGIVNYYD